MAGSTDAAVRRHDLDHLRVLAFGVLVVAHASNLFVTWGSWPIRSGHSSWLLERIMLFVCLWRLPLVFLVAGAGAAFSLRKRGPGGFTLERAYRLLPPLAMGIFLIAPFQTWIEARIQGHTQMDFLSFLPQVWASGPAPDGLLGWQHLWFVGYLLVISTGVAFLHQVLQRNSRRTEAFLERCMQHRLVLLGLAFVPGAFTALLGADHPPTYVLTNDWWNLAQSICFFLAGYAIARHPGTLPRIEELRGRFLALGLLSVGLLFTQDWLGIRTLWWWDADWHFFAKGVASWAWVFTILGFASRHLNRPVAWLRKANEAVFPFFLWHLAVLWGVGLLLQAWQWPFWAEFIAASGLTIAGTALLVQAFIKPFEPMRFLFGMRGFAPAELKNAWETWRDLLPR